MTQFRPFVALAALALAAAASTACTEAQAPSPSPAAAAAHDMPHPPGPQMLLFAALHHLDLTPDQRATIERAAHATGPSATMHHDVAVAVAAGVRAGKLDEATVLARLDAGAMAAPLDMLHATLTPVQRRALVDAIAQHLGDHGGGLLGRLLARVELTPDQRQTIDQIRAGEPAESFEAFAADHYDAGAALREHIQRMLHQLAAILPVLDASQRESLASAIETAPLGHG